MIIVYLTNCFGTPSHTFIRREINELRKRGFQIFLFGIHKDTNIAEDAHGFVEETKYLYPLNPLKIFVLNIFVHDNFLSKN